MPALGADELVQGVELSFAIHLLHLSRSSVLGSLARPLSCVNLAEHHGQAFLLRADVLLKLLSFAL